MSEDTFVGDQTQYVADPAIDLANPAIELADPAIDHANSVIPAIIKDEDAEREQWGEESTKS